MIHPKGDDQLNGAYELLAGCGVQLAGWHQDDCGSA